MTSELDFDGHSSIVTVDVAFDRYLPTLNDFIGKNKHAYNTAKAYWSGVLEAALYGPVGDVQFLKSSTKSVWEDLYVERFGELKGQYSRIDVEGWITYPARNRGPRDQGNARGFLEKVLGDVFEKAGHFEKDDNWDCYSFGGLERSYEKGVSRTRLAILARPFVQNQDFSVCRQTEQKSGLNNVVSFRSKEAKVQIG